MPAPQSFEMKQAARAKFSTFAIKVPENWQKPPDAQQYALAFKDSDKQSSPDPTVPPLFLPYTLNRYHTDIQKKLTASIGGFLDDMTDAICTAWASWQSAATLQGVVITAAVASVGQVVGPPIGPLIIARLSSKSPNQLKFIRVIANVLDTSWTAYTGTIRVPALPWYPAFAAVPAPSVPPTPNIPTPLAALVQVPTSLNASLMKQQMIAALGDPTAQYSAQIFDAICTAFELCFLKWMASTTVTNVLGVGAGPGTPIIPAPVAGIGTMVPGGFV